MTISFNATTNNFQVPNKSKKYDRSMPIKAAAINTVTWTGIGLGFDYLIMNKIFKIKSSIKQSLLLNGIFGLVMGAFAFHKANKLQKEQQVKNFDDLFEYSVNKKS